MIKEVCLEDKRKKMNDLGGSSSGGNTYQLSSGGANGGNQGSGGYASYCCG